MLAVEAAERPARDQRFRADANGVNAARDAVQFASKIGEFVVGKDDVPD